MKKYGSNIADSNKFHIMREIEYDIRRKGGDGLRKWDVLSKLYGFFHMEQVLSLRITFAHKGMWDIFNSDPPDMSDRKELIGILRGLHIRLRSKIYDDDYMNPKLPLGCFVIWEEISQQRSRCVGLLQKPLDACSYFRRWAILAFSQDLKVQHVEIERCTHPVHFLDKNTTSRSVKGLLQAVDIIERPSTI